MITAIVNEPPPRPSQARAIPPAAIDHARVVRPEVARRMIGKETGYTPSHASMYRWLLTGKILASRVGAKWFVDRGALLHTIEQMKQGESLFWS